MRNVVAAAAVLSSLAMSSCRVGPNRDGAAGRQRPSEADRHAQRSYTALARRPRQLGIDARRRRAIGKSGPAAAAAPARPTSPSNPGLERCTNTATRPTRRTRPLVACKASGGPSFFNAPGFEILEAPELQDHLYPEHGRSALLAGDSYGWPPAPQGIASYFPG